MTPTCEWGVLRPCAKMTAPKRNWERGRADAKSRGGGNISVRCSQRILSIVGFIAGIVVALVASLRPSAAMMICGCANYGLNYVPQLCK
jgi:hypothetical protein